MIYLRSANCNSSYMINASFLIMQFASLCGLVYGAAPRVVSMVLKFEQMSSIPQKYALNAECLLAQREECNK